MRKALTVIALMSAAAVSDAQTRTAIDAAKNAAAAVEARNAPLAVQEQVAQRASQPPASTQGAAVNAAAGSQATGVPVITREVFQYDGGGRRDPFLSLARSGALRPHISELTLVVAMMGTGGQRGIATIRDNTTKEQYLVKVGDSLGRYRVVGIDSRSVTFAIEEFGFSRQEKLVMGDTSTVRNQ